MAGMSAVMWRKRDGFRCWSYVASYNLQGIITGGRGELEKGAATFRKRSVTA